MQLLSNIINQKKININKTIRELEITLETEFIESIQQNFNQINKCPEGFDGYRTITKYETTLHDRINRIIGKKSQILDSQCLSKIENKETEIEILFNNVQFTKKEINNHINELVLYFHSDKTANPNSSKWLKDKLELLAKEEVEKLTQKELKELHAVMAECAYRQYNAACKIADKAKRLYKQVKLQENIALCLPSYFSFFAGFRFENRILSTIIALEAGYLIDVAEKKGLEILPMNMNMPEDYKKFNKDNSENAVSIFRSINIELDEIIEKLLNFKEYEDNARKMPFQARLKEEEFSEEETQLKEESSQNVYKELCEDEQLAEKEVNSLNSLVYWQKALKKYEHMLEKNSK
ncbi:8992_t:CDS:2 [Cetraspora pellucida]|uniref:8992_t:CDS:1 n=1 Tax=Cetraspora pellucida TaxID=1433469 RepID=A0A9N9EA11_9GLOM|nr:8992_t:CDS:2 [Cetraspora pellucida]